MGILLTISFLGSLSAAMEYHKGSNKTPETLALALRLKLVRFLRPEPNRGIITAAVYSSKAARVLVGWEASYQADMNGGFFSSVRIRVEVPVLAKVRAPGVYI